MTSFGTQFLQNIVQTAPQGVQGAHMPAVQNSIQAGMQTGAQNSFQKSDLLQKYIEKNTIAQDSYTQGVLPKNPQNGYIQNPVSSYVPSSTMRIPSVLDNKPQGSEAEASKDPKKIKKAKIAAFSLGALILGTTAAILGATKSGRGAVRAFSSFVQTNLKTFFADFSKKHDSEWADKVYKNLHKLSVESDNASGSLENFGNGKDVFCRHIAENLSGFKADGTKLPPSNNRAVQFIRNTFGRFFGAYHKFDSKTTGFYRGKVNESTVKRY